MFSELKKGNGGMGSFYRSKHELVFVFKVGTAPALIADLQQLDEGSGGSGPTATDDGMLDIFVDVPDVPPVEVPPPVEKKSGSLWDWLNPVSSAHAAEASKCNEALDEHIARQRRVEIILAEQPDLLKSIANVGLSLVGASKFGADTALAEKTPATVVAGRHRNSGWDDHRRRPEVR